MIFVTNLKEWYRLPTNKKEGIIFTTMMCFLMVLGMSAYNFMAASRSSFIKFVDWSSAWIRGGFHFGCLHHRCAGEKNCL